MKKILFFSIIIIFITVILIFRNQQKKEIILFDPGITSIEVSPSPSPPQTFKYDSTTDLEKELESIDPKVLDSDFNE